VKGKTRSHLNFESHPLFMVVASLKVLGGLQKCSGMLNVLPYMVSVKRETQHLVARKWYGYRVEKETRFQSFELSWFQALGAFLETWNSEALKPGVTRWHGRDLLARL
jgi:hypothetical protein